MTQKAESLKQPKVFYLSTITSACERFSYYVLAMIFTIYTKNVYNLSDKEAFAFFAIFTALSYVIPVIGGYLADNVIGIKRCIGIGIFLEFIGNVILIIPNANYSFFIIALTCIIVGCGFFKTAPTNLMGRAYKENDPRIDSGFTLFYMGINIGGFFSSFIGGLGQPGHWNIPFYFSSAALLFGIIWFFFFKHHAADCEVEIGKKQFGFVAWAKTLGIAAAIIFGTLILMYFNKIGQYFLYLSCIAIFFYIVYEILRSPLEEKKSIFVCFVLIMEVLVFYILYFQVFTSMELFIERCVDRNIFNFSVPTVWYLTLDTIWIILLSPLLAYIYKALETKGKGISITVKFPVGLFITALCFATLALSSFFRFSNGLTSMVWIVIAFFFFAFGELLTSALGVAMITRIAPARLYGILMGAWFLLTSALGAQIAGITAGFSNIPDNYLSNIPKMFSIYSHTFSFLALIAIIASILFLTFAPFLNRIAGLNK